MKYILSIIVVSIFISCSPSQNKEKGKKTEILKSASTEKQTRIEIGQISDIKKNTNERSPKFIKERLKKLIGKSYKKRCEEIGISYPPNFVLFRTFKFEKEFEIWVSNNRSDKLKLLITLPICAMDNEPGTKLIRGDGKTPEGFYSCKILYGSSNWFMWMSLNNSEINNYGATKKGSSFKLCLDYPLKIDRSRTKKFAKNNSAGSAICIHGNCVSAGCISFKNKDFLAVFLSSTFHNAKKYGNPKIHIFPFRFTEKIKQEQSKKVKSKMNSEELISFWEDIEPAYRLFERNHKAIKVSYLNNKYKFAEY